MKTKHLLLTAGLALGVSSVTAFSAWADIPYVSNGNNDTIEKFTPGGVGSVFASGLSNPNGFAFTDDVGVPLKLPSPPASPSPPPRWSC